MLGDTADGPGLLRRRWYVFVMCTVALIGVVGWVAIAKLFEDSATPIATEDAVDTFRAEAEPTATVPAVATPTSTPVPNAQTLAAPGVYVYATTGEEGIDALGGTRHPYPATTTITVQPGGCGIIYRWDALVERSEQWEMCETGDGLVMAGFEASHQFFGRDNVESPRCDEPILLVPRDFDPGDSTMGVCRAGELVETLVVTYVGRETLDVGETEVDVVRVFVDVSVGPPGARTEGESTSEYWVSPDGLFVRVVETTTTTAKEIVGDVNYDEQFDLLLQDLEPRR